MNRLKEAIQSAHLARMRLDYARTFVRDIIRRAYDAGAHGDYEDGPTMPTQQEITLALEGIEKAAAESHIAERLLQSERLLAGSAPRPTFERLLSHFMATIPNWTADQLSSGHMKLSVPEGDVERTKAFLHENCPVAYRIDVETLLPGPLQPEGGTTTSKS